MDLHRIVIHNLYDKKTMEESDELPNEMIHQSSNSSDSDECYEVLTTRGTHLHHTQDSQSQLHYEPEKKRRKTTSSCWQYFDVVYNDNNIKCGLCRHCGKTLRAANGTKGLLSHISSCEGLKYNKELVVERKSTQARLSVNPVENQSNIEMRQKRVVRSSDGPRQENIFISDLRELIADGATGTLFELSL